MATQAELQQEVTETPARATAARTAWKSAIPGEDAPKMTDEEQAVVDDLENKFVAAKADRKAAERALEDFNIAETARKAAAAVAPVGSGSLSELDKKWILAIAGERGLTDTAWADEVAGPRPDGWTGF